MHAAYSDLKAAWHLGAIEKMRRGEQIVPRQVQLVLSDLCNQDCGFCSYRMSTGLSSELFVTPTTHNPNRMIPRAKSEEIIRDCAELGVQAIQFTGGGEPTVHPDHMALFRLCLDSGMRASLVTNGLKMLDGAWGQVLPRMAWIRVSLDAGTARTYSETRRTPERNFSRVLANVSALARGVDPDRCLLGIGFVATPRNWFEIVEATRLARESGAAYIRISAMFSTEFTRPFESVYDHIRDEIGMAREAHESASFKVVDLFGDRLSDLEQHAPDYEFCGYQQFNMYIGADLNVYRCCSTAYTTRGTLGSLKNARLVDWFESNAKHAAYEQFDARGCKLCQFNGKNRVINYLVGPKPTHVEFV